MADGKLCVYFEQLTGIPGVIFPYNVILLDGKKENFNNMVNSAPSFMMPSLFLAVEM